MRLSTTNASRATRAVSGFLVNGTEYMCEYHVNSASQHFSFDDDGAGAGVGGVTTYSSVTHNDTGFYAFTFTATASNRLRIMLSLIHI